MSDIYEFIDLIERMPNRVKFWMLDGDVTYEVYIGSDCEKTYVAYCVRDCYLEGTKRAYWTTEDITSVFNNHFQGRKLVEYIVWGCDCGDRGKNRGNGGEGR